MQSNLIEGITILKSSWKTFYQMESWHFAFSSPFKQHLILKINLMLCILQHIAEVIFVGNQRLPVTIPNLTN